MIHIINKHNTQFFFFIYNFALFKKNVFSNGQEKANAVDKNQ